MNTLDIQYQQLLTTILANGVVKKDRTGTGTMSIFGHTVRHKMSEGFPLLTTKKMYFKGIVTELLWFLRGETNIRPLVLADCHIWNGDAYKAYASKKDLPIKYLFSKAGVEPCAMDDFYRHYTMDEFIEKIRTDEEFAEKWGELGPIYGKQWRNWQYIDLDNFVNLDNCDDPELKGRGVFYKTDSIDQIDNLINDLKHNPDSRRLMVTAWNPGEIKDMTLPPCHYTFQLYTRELNRLERIQLGLKVGWKPKGHIENFEHEDLEGLNIPTRAISLLWSQRSCDTFLGLPFNIASYGLLLTILGKLTNMVPDELIGQLGDTHIYTNHIDQAIEQLGRDLEISERLDLASKVERFDPLDFGIGNPSDEQIHMVCDSYEVPRRSRIPFDLPSVIINTEFWNPENVFDNNWDSILKAIKVDDFGLLNYKSHPGIKAPLSN